ncbi:MAG: cobyrinate a,c-diamide synthase [Alphaproteobacteria bacterium]|nr:cobyrinate a,c-diamide synthase [Alphaproteobacteria bacterium]
MPAASPAPGLIIAAPSSGCGKTTVTLGLLRSFRNAGRRVSSFKAGPDYIDPAFHAAASGRRCLNLDGWAMRGDTLAGLATALSRDADLVIGEGVMGLFDGAPDGTGSTADLSAQTGWPVVLVVDVAAQAASAAAVVHGFASFRDDVRLAGVILNRVGSEGHRRTLERALDGLGPPLLGCLPQTPDIALPERHLGLVQAGEHADLDAYLDAAAELVARHLDLEAVAQCAAPATLPECRTAPALPPLGQRIAVATDAAFAFAYPHMLDGWRAAGAELTRFSPLASEAPAADADAVYLPGGYPELHAGKLAANHSFLDGLRAAAERGSAIWGECGGYMVLGEGLVDAQGARHAMAGLLPVETSFAERGLHLGYRQARLAADGPLGRTGRAFRGHEFHYARVLREDTSDPTFHCRDARDSNLGPVGSRRGRVMGSFIHLIDAADDA